MKSVVTGCNLYNKLQQYRENQGENGFLGNAPRNYTRHLMLTVNQLKKTVLWTWVFIILYWKIARSNFFRVKQSGMFRCFIVDTSCHPRGNPLSTRTLQAHDKLLFFIRVQ